MLVLCIDFYASLKAVFSQFAVQKTEEIIYLISLDYVQRLYSHLVLNLDNSFVRSTLPLMGYDLLKCEPDNSRLIGTILFFLFMEENFRKH